MSSWVSGFGRLPVCLHRYGAIQETSKVSPRTSRHFERIPVKLHLSGVREVIYQFQIDGKNLQY
jgi:hypothetical protein